MRRCRPASGVGAVLCGLLGTGLHAAAADSLVTVAATPTTLELCPNGGIGRALVTVHNSSTAPIHNVCLRAFTNGPVENVGGGLVLLGVAQADSAGSTLPSSECPSGLLQQELAPGASVSRLATLKLTSQPAAGSVAAVYLHADYEVREKQKTHRATAITTLEVRPASVPGIDGLKLETKTEFSSLHEGEEGMLVLTISNATTEALKLAEPVFTPPAHTSLVLPPGTAPSTTLTSTLPPQSAISVARRVKANDTVKPGKYVGRIDVDAETRCGIRLHRVTSYEVALGVFGQSELLTILGVPSLLLLPGLLILASWMLLSRFKPSRISWLVKDTGELQIGVRDPEFWLLGITLSLLLFFLRPQVMRLGYDHPYGLRDIAKLWGYSIRIGLALYLLLFVVNKLSKILSKWRTAALTLTSNDDVTQVLRKMRWRRWPLKSWPLKNCVPVKLTGAVERRGFRLWEEKAGETVWVIPKIKWTVGDTSVDPSKAATAKELFNMIKSSGRVQWVPESNFSGPIVVKESDLENVPGVTSKDLVAVVSE